MVEIKKSKRSSRLIAIFFSIFCVLTIIAMATTQETELKEVNIHVDASMVDNQMMVKGGAPLPDGSIIRLMTHREVTFKNDRQNTTGDVFLMAADAEVSNGKFEATLLLDDRQWYDRLLENPECEFVATADFVKVEAAYIPEKPKSLFGWLSKPAGFSFAVKLPFSIKLPFFTKEKRIQYLPATNETLVEYPFSSALD